MKAKTINLQGKEYAQVAERIRLFRSECPNGLIETTPTIDEKNIMFKCRILKDKAKDESGESTGHSWGENKGAKAFEKLESISIGRALATLGYLASGEIASSEEMEDFHAYKQEQKEEAILSLRSAESLDSLKEVFMSLGSLIADPDIIAVKNELKLKLKQP